MSMNTITLLNALNQAFDVPQSNQIGGIQVDTTLEEVYEDSLEITEHPVEAGAAITDHSFKRPMEVVLMCGWSDSSSSGASDFSDVSFNSFSTGSVNPGAGNTGSFSGGSMLASDYVAGIYSQLLQLQESRQPIAIVTGLRLYDNMLIQSLRVRRDQRTQYALNVQAVLRQVIIVSTQTATLAPQANHANPASTADTVNTGQQTLGQTELQPGQLGVPGL
jgi:hypothetical protein